MNSKQISKINEFYNISEDIFEKTGAFNAIVGVDSPFFIDPLLLDEISIPELNNANYKVKKHFTDVITLISADTPRTLMKAIKMMRLREIRGLGIGYGSKTDDGSAIGPVLAKKLVYSAKELIQIGFNDPNIFDLMGLFEEDFGADRISDAIANIIQDEIYSYTERVAKDLSIKRDFSLKSKSGHDFSLPTHPLGNKALVLIPEKILRTIPIALSPEDIPEAAAFNSDLRAKFNELLTPVLIKNDENTKQKIKEYLFNNKESFKMLLDSYKSAKPKSYDFIHDPEGKHRWIDEARAVVTEISLGIPDEINDIDELKNITETIIKAYCDFIEKKGGWKGLYDPNKKPLNEEHACLLFYAISLLYCKNSNIDISPQSNAGQGPVDFKLSRGSSKIVVEVKLTSGSVFHGYQKQTRIYQESEDAQYSFYVVIQVTNSSKALGNIEKMIEEEDKDKIKHPELIVVNALPKESASKA